MYSEATFGQWLRQRRRMLDLTQADLARRVGCSEITIRKFEADVRTPSRQIAELLASCLEVPAADRTAFVAFARGRQREDEAPAVSRTPAEPDGALARASNLPVPLTRLLGRDQDAALICQTLVRDDVRILTLIGPPGIGKTRLSLHVAHVLSEIDGYDRAFADGAVFVPLAAVASPNLVVSAIAQALHVSEAAGQSLQDRLVDILRDRSLLLVLDNFEHVLPAGPDVAQLLMTCPGLKVLATSRAALHLRGEHLFPVAPLALPSMTWPLNKDAVVRSPAGLLFVERAHAVAPDFELTDANAATVAAICARLEGLPLAIELVAAHSRLLPPLALLSRLGQRLALLAVGPSDLPPRQQTLRNAIAWSYNLLAPAERRLFDRLGVFVGNYSLEAIEQICAGDVWQAEDVSTWADKPAPSGDVPFSILPELEVLVDHNLLTRSTAPDGETRFSMLETIREYALERLADRGELAVLRRRHAKHYLALAESVEPHLSGAMQDVWLDRLECEHDHFRAALSWAHEAGAVEIGLRVAAALWRFWYTRCYLSEGRRWLSTVLAMDDGRTPGVRARALLGEGVLTNAQGDHREARALIEESVAIARRLGDQECLAIGLYHLGVLIFDRGEADGAITAMEECLRIQQTRADRAGIASALNGLGNLLLGRDDVRAAALLEESVALHRELRNTRGIAFTLHSLGVASLQRGSHAHALHHFRAARRLFRQLGDTIGIADCLAGLAAVAGRQHRYGRAARLWRTATDLRTSIGAPLSAAEREIYERHIAGALEHAGEAALSIEKPLPLAPVV